MEGFRLSPQQERLWQLHSNGNTAMHAQAYLTLPNDLDRPALRAAVERICQRYEVLRTLLRRPAGVRMPLQVIAGDPLLRIRESAVVGEDAWISLRAQRIRQDFDLESGPLVSVDLVSVGGANRLLMTVSAACADTPSLARLTSELARAYADDADVEDVLQYADVAEWQHDLLTAAETAPGRQFWAARAAAPTAPFPFSHGAASDAPFAPDRVSRPLEAATWKAAREVAVDGASGVPGIVLTVWRVLLGLITDGDPVVSVETDNRRHEDLRDAVGPLRLTLPMTSELGSASSFRVAASRLAAAVADLVRWQECHDPRRGDSDPSAGAAFTWDDLGVELPAGWLLEEAVSFAEPFVVRLRGVARPDAMTLNLDFDSTRLTGADAGKLLDIVCVLLDHVVKQPDMPLSELGRIAGEVFAPRPTEPVAVTPRHDAITVTEAVRAHAEAWGDHPALVDASATMSYRELQQRSTTLAGVLRGHGVGPGTPVVVLAERGIATVVGLLGIAAAGGCFVPIDPALPAQRIAALCAQIGCSLAVGPSRLTRRLPGGLTPISTDDLTESPVDATASTATAGPADLAYIIFTSGSTGMPKPVAVTHGNVAAYALSMIDRIGLRPGDGCASPAPFSADLGFTALFPALYARGVVHLMSAEEAVDPAAFGGRMTAHAVDCLKITPSHLRALLDGDTPAAVLPRRWLVLGGEACDWDLVHRVHELAPSCRILNHYGPTETTVGVLTFEVRVADGPDRATATVPVGRPLPHATVRLLDGAGAPVAPWVPGEICVGGAGIARGYLGQPGETASRFAPDALAAQAGARLYRTGDRARQLGDGTVVFLGRSDGQVKIRGFRVEVGEVEAAVRTLPGVREAAVTVRRDAAGSPILMAHVVPAGLITAGDLGAKLSLRLPDYMVPATIAVVDALPRTANGKIDRRSLAEAPTPTTRPEYVAPQDPVEETLAAVFASVLGMERVGREDNFFAIGGDSILSIRAVARAGRAGVGLTLPLLFQHQSVAAVARAISDGPVRRHIAEQDPVCGPVPATPIQRWLFDQRLTRPGFYSQVVVLRPERNLDGACLEQACRALLTHHDALRLRVSGNVADDPRLELTEPDHRPAPLAERVDVSAVAGDVLDAAVHDAVQAVHRSMAIDSGCLFRFLHVIGPSGDRLILVAHHLVVDAVSWHVLIEDLASAYTQAERGGAISLPAKTTDVRTIAQRQVEHASGDEVAAQLGYWRQVVADSAVAGLSRAVVAAPTNTFGRARTVSMTASELTTRALLNPGPKGDRSPHAVLLAAVGIALAAHTGRSRVAIDVEGHGRDLPWPDVDVSRTVGWFTTVYPVAWDVRADDDPESALARVARAQSGVPDGGLGFGILRHLRSDSETDILRRTARPGVRFNYLGRIDTTDDNGLFTVVTEDTGPTADPEAVRPYLLDVNASIRGERLTVAVTFCPDIHREPELRRIVDDIGATITRLVACSDVDPAATAPTFAESGLSDDELSGLMDSLELIAEDDA